MARMLNVKRTSNEELTKQWRFNPNLKGKLFIRCNAAGNVNWDKSPVYNADELIEKEKVNIINK